MANWTPLRDALARIETSVTYTWADLDSLVGGLPRSAYIHPAFWSGARAGWRGFATTNVRVGQEVTFVRANSTVPQHATPTDERTRALTARELSPPEFDGRADLLLVGCVKRKLDYRAPARLFYTSALFRMERDFAERSGIPWLILSAEHGVVHPTHELAPYDLHLSTTPKSYRAAWGARVVGQLASLMVPLDGAIIEIHAGAAYVDAVRDLLGAEGAHVREPLRGLRLGPRLAWYKGKLKDAAQVSEPARASTHDTQIIADDLSTFARSETPTAFLRRAGTELRTPGLYSWWVDREGAEELSSGLGLRLKPGLIYAGLAGATRPKSGLKSTNTLWGRVRGMHLGGRHEYSTFRLSLGAILANMRGEPTIDEDDLTAWMHRHLRVLAIPFPDAHVLHELETDVLQALDPPLNIAKVTKTPIRRRLRELRTQIGS